MPFGSEGVESGIGLALSGGGFRATLFHCGALWRLNELGYLRRIKRFSAVSGGAITLGVLGTRWSGLRFDGNGRSPDLVPMVVDPLRKFCERTIDVSSALEGIFRPFKRTSDIIADELDELLEGKRLSDLPEPPRVIFNSTNLATGVDFRFSRPYAGDYRIGLIENPSFRVAQAVAASAAFPPFLSPVVIETDPKAFRKVPGADLYDTVAYRKELHLTDGGAYDNMGLETVWKRYDTVLVSDAGAPFAYAPETATDWLRQTLRVLDITVNQARGLRKRWLIEYFKKPPGEKKQGTYWGIMTEIDGYKLASALPVPAAVTAGLARIRTRLNHFNAAEQCSLINWGYAVCDAAMRTFVIPPSAVVPAPAWPYSEYALDKPLSGEVEIEPTNDLVDVRSMPESP
jgi:NTE family protein